MPTGARSKVARQRASLSRREQGEVDGALPGSPVLDRGGGEAGEQEGDEGHDPELDEGRALPDPGQVGLTSGELEGPGLLVHRKGHREGELGRHLASRLAVEEQVLPVGPGPVEHLQPDLLEVLLLQDVPHEVVHAERGTIQPVSASRRASPSPGTFPPA